MAAALDYADIAELDAPDYLDDFGGEDAYDDGLENLSSDVDRWGDEDYEADTNYYLYGFL